VPGSGDAPLFARTKVLLVSEFNQNENTGGSENRGQIQSGTRSIATDATVSVALLMFHSKFLYVACSGRQRPSDRTGEEPV
jgi:hypothetical protein